MASIAGADTGRATNGTATAAGDIAVENPATGEVIAHVPDIDRRAGRRARPRAARAAQPAWEALGFEGRGRILRRAQKWLIDNSERVIETIVSETGKTYEDAQRRRGRVRRHRLRLLGQERRRSTWPTRRSSRAMPLLKGKKLVLRYRPLGLIGVIGPWNYPLDQLVRRLHPGAGRRQRVILKPQRGHAADVAAAGRGAARVRHARRRLPGRHRRGRHGRGARRRGRHDHVHRLDGAPASKVMASGGRDADPGVARARRQGPDDRAGRRRPRARRQRRRLLLDAQRRPDLHLVERVYVEAPVYDEFVAKVTEKVARAAPASRSTGPGTVDVGSMTFPPQVDIVERHVERRGRQGRARARRRQARPRRAGRLLVRADGARRRRPHDGRA